MSGDATADRIEGLHRKLEKDARAGGYNLNPETETTMQLLEGIQTNIERYGYGLCPCRLTGGSRETDLDVICPCDYRDADLDEYGTCY